MTHHHQPAEMLCAVCAQPLTPGDRHFADCWMDPGGIACVAHRSCLRRLGERDLGLRPEDTGRGPTHEGSRPVIEP